MLTRTTLKERAGKEMRTKMELQPSKHAQCSHDKGLGVLLVDIDSETLPRRDRRGNWQYYCLKGHHLFSVRSAKADILIQKEKEEEEKQRVTSLV
jgi:hypothetical protein